MIIVLMGVAGSGKTTVGPRLAERLGCPFLDGDALHPPANVAKMAAGIALTDADRLPWLAAIHARVLDAFRSGDSLVVACSALKASYRAVLYEGVPVAWVYLKGAEQLIEARLERRTGHFMKPGMLASQFDALEEPSDALVMDISRPPDAVVDGILAKLGGPAREGTGGG